MIQMSSFITCNSNLVEDRNDNEHVHRNSRTHLLEAIENSLPHKLILGQWEKEEEILSRRIEQKDTRHMSIQNEIYQLLGLYNTHIVWLPCHYTRILLASGFSTAENGKGKNKGWDKQTVIHNKTEDIIALRDMHRYVWREVRMELKPDESKKISVKSPSTFLRMGAILKVDERTERDINLRIDMEQLVGRNLISICKDAQGRYFVQEE